MSDTFRRYLRDIIIAGGTGAATYFGGPAAAQLAQDFFKAVFGG